jgi:O-antigen/teichoic acid export membrane protein
MGDYVLMYAGSIIIARSLGIDAYGHYAALVSGIHVLLALSSFGLEAALIRHIASFQGAGGLERTRFLARRGMGLRLALFAVAAVFGAAIALTRGWFAPPVDNILLVLVAGYGLTRALVLVAVTVLTARFRTGPASVIGIVGRLVEVTGFLIGSMHGLSAAVVFAIFLASGLIQILLHVIWCNDVWFGESKPVPLRPVVVFAGVFGINAVVEYFLGRQGDIALLALIGGNPGGTSRYDVSYSLLQAGAMVATLGLSGVSLAALSRYPAGDGIARAGLYAVLVRVNSLLTIPVLGFLFVAAGDILALLYGGPFVTATPVLRILLILRIISRIFAGGENADLLLSMDKVRPLVAIGIIAAALTIGLHFLFIPLYGAEGAAAASGFGALTANILGYSYVRRVLASGLQMRSWFSLTGTTVVAGAAAWYLLPDAHGLDGIALKAVLFGLTWVLCAMVIRPVEKLDGEALGRVLPFIRMPIGLIARSHRGVQ